MTQEVGLLVLVDALVLGLLYLTVFQKNCDTPTHHKSICFSTYYSEAHTVASNTKP